MANRYWVGGTGTWDTTSTANWSATSGGAAGASVPTTADTVYFDSLSGTGTCTTATGATCSVLSLFTPTLTLKLGANLTIVGGFIHAQGAIDLNNNVFTVLTVTSQNTNTRSIAFGSSGKIVVTGNNATVWTNATSTGFTYTGTSLIEFNYSGSTGTRTINTNAGTGDETNSLSMSITAGTDIIAFQSTSKLKNLIFTGFAGTLTNVSRTIYGSLIFSSGMTVTGGTAGITFAGTLGTQQITTNGKTLDFPLAQTGVGGTVQLQDNLTMGSTRTFTLTAGTLDLVDKTLSTGLFNSSNSNVRSIAFGTGNITLTGNNGTIWTTSTSTNLTATGTPLVNATYAGATGTRTVTAGFALPISLNVSAGTDIFTTGGTSNFINLNFTGFAGTLGNAARNVSGNLTFAAGMTLTAGTSTLNFNGTSGTQQITTAGLTLDFPIAFNGIGGTFAFQDALTQGSTRNFLLVNGTLKLKASATSTVGTFNVSGTNQKYLQSTLAGSQATLSQASGTVDVSYLTIQDINATGGATFNAYVNQGNIDAGNVDGWDFGISPVVGGAEYTYALRSFTQPRRF
jgi:hypothetical protein